MSPALRTGASYGWRVEGAEEAGRRAWGFGERASVDADRPPEKQRASSGRNRPGTSPPARARSYSPAFSAVYLGRPGHETAIHRRGRYSITATCLAAESTPTPRKSPCLPQWAFPRVPDPRRLRAASALQEWSGAIFPRSRPRANGLLPCRFRDPPRRESPFRKRISI